MAKGKSAIILGATGLIGGHLMDELSEDDTFTSLTVLSRRPVEFDTPKIQVKVIDFQDEKSFRNAIEPCDCIFSAIGTTNRKVDGDEEAYRRIDFDIPVNAARYGSEKVVNHFLLVSSVGANSTSGNFYLKLKGEIEEAIQRTNIPNISVFRPSILLGDRNESRPAERIGQIWMNAFSFLIPSVYKPIEAKKVSKAMVAAIDREQPGFQIYHYKEIVALSKPD